MSTTLITERLIITERAADRLENIVRECANGNQSLRLVIALTGTGIMVDSYKDGDVVFPLSTGSLLVATTLLAALDGAVLDYLPTAVGPHMTLSWIEGGEEGE